jgi:hypothetical protein
VRPQPRLGLDQRFNLVPRVAAKRVNHGLWTKPRWGWKTKPPLEQYPDALAMKLSGLRVSGDSAAWARAC